MLQQESIYNLIPKGKIVPGRGASYTSKYPPNIPPTASTFNLIGTSFPGVANCSGEYKLPRGGHSPLKQSATFGKPNGQNKVSPDNYHRKGETFKILPPLEKIFPTNEVRKPRVPTVNDKPIMGLKSETNYIIANAVDNILMQPRHRVQSQESRFHKSFGKVPEYLKRYKLNHENELNEMKEVRRRHQEAEDAKQRLLTDKEVSDLREGLKKKWEIYNARYNKMTHKKVYDNLVLLRNKEGLEKELGIIEDDLKKLSCKNVVIDMTK